MKNAVGVALIVGFLMGFPLWLMWITVILFQVDQLIWAEVQLATILWLPFIILITGAVFFEELRK